MCSAMEKITNCLLNAGDICAQGREGENTDTGIHTGWCAGRDMQVYWQVVTLAYVVCMLTNKGHIAVMVCPVVRKTTKCFLNAGYWGWDGEYTGTGTDIHTG